VWQRQTEQGGVCRWLRPHAYHHRQACACRCHTAARIFSQTLARRVCQDFRAAFPCRRRPPRVAASKLVLSEAERIRRTWGWIASQRPFRTDAPLPFAIPKAPLHYALRLPPTCHDIFTHTAPVGITKSIAASGEGLPTNIKCTLVRVQICGLTNTGAPEICTHKKTVREPFSVVRRGIIGVVGHLWHFESHLLSCTLRSRHCPALGG